MTCRTNDAYGGLQQTGYMDISPNADGGGGGAQGVAGYMDVAAGGFDDGFNDGEEDV